MTDFGTYFFLSIFGLIIGLAIQYYLIKSAVLSALKKNTENTKTDREIKWLLEIIVKAVGDKETAAPYFLRKRKLEYAEQKKQIEFHTTNGKDRANRIEKLNEEYADLFETKKEA